MEYASNTIDWNEANNYVLQWLYESEFSRQLYSCLCYRVDLAMEGKPYSNLYKEEIASLTKDMSEEEKKMIGAHCLHLPEGRSFLLAQSLNTIANQMSSGVDSYECTINDPYNFVEDGTEDLLAAKCSEDYVENELGLFAPTFSKDLQRYGMVAVLVKYDPKTNKNDIVRINPRNCWYDTMYSSTGRARFVGYSTMIDWRTLKKMIKDNGDEINDTIEAPSTSVLSEDKKKIQTATYKNRKIRTLNGLDIYVDDLNRLASSPSLRASTNFRIPEYEHDLGWCYNTGYYQSLAQDAKARTKSGYHGQDVELTVIYDLNRKIEFKIINRRFVVSMNKRAFRRNIAFPIMNPITDEMTTRIDEVSLDCPLKVKMVEMDTMDKFPYPTSPAMRMLETHNKLCSWFAKREHVSKILATLRIETNGADANSLKKVMNVMGVILDDIQGDINSVNFQYAYDPIDSEVARLEKQMKEYLSAYTEFDAMQAMGDRASAAESGMAIGAISQGLAAHQNILMSLYADIAKQCLMNRVVYSPLQEFPVNNLGNYSTLTAQELAMTSIITVKSKMAKKVQEKMLSQTALAILGSAVGQKASVDLQALLMEQALYGQVPRKVAAQGLRSNEPSPQEMAIAQQQAQNQAALLQQNQQMFEQNPLPYEAEHVVQNNTPEEVDQIITGLNSPEGDMVMDETMAQNLPPELLDMPQQDGIALNLETSSPELGSALANDSGFYG